jgi:DNA-binding response OmpR family regulator
MEKEDGMEFYDMLEKTKRQYPQRELDVIFIVEDDPIQAELLSQIVFEETTYYAMTFPDACTALKAIAFIRPVLFILDYRLPGTSGLVLYDRLRTMRDVRGVPIIILSADREVYEEIAGRELLVLDKPFEIDTLTSAIEKAIVKARIFG